MARRERYDGPAGPEVELPRGDVTEGLVRIGDTVRRPHRPGSDTVAAYLDHLEAVGFDRAPRYLGRDDRGRDVLDHLAGDVAGPRLPPWCGTDDALASVGRLTRRLHDASIGWLPAAALLFPRDIEQAMPVALPPGEPVAVMHNDITPQNVVFRDGEAWGVIDFDLAGRTTALTDLANTAMHWVPLQDPVDRDPVFEDADVADRLRILLDAYGLPPDRRADLLDAATLRFGGLEASMRWRAENLGGGWARMWAEGARDLIVRRVAWFASVRDDLAGRDPTRGTRSRVGRGGQDGGMTDPADTDALQQQFVAARERLSTARATLDQYASTVGLPVDTVPEEPANVVNPEYDAAREEYEAANAEFVRLETALKPSWAEQAEQPVE